MRLSQWILLILWPILMVAGLFFMVNFRYETLGLVGTIMMAFGFICASIFMFGKVDTK